MINFQAVSKAYWKKPPRKSGVKRKATQIVILENCTAEFPRGRSVAVLGAKEAGKSTLMRLIAGREFPDRGRVVKTVQMAPLGGFPGLNRTISGRENCRFLARLYGIDHRNLEQFIQDFTELGDQFNSPAGTYTRAMRLRVSLGLFMAPDFDCYLFDDGIWFGDSGVKERAKAIFDAKRQSASVILASNSPSQIRTYCNMGALLHEGRLQIFDDLEEAIRAFQNLGGTLVEGDFQPPDETAESREVEEENELF